MLRKDILDEFLLLLNNVLNKEGFSFKCSSCRHQAFKWRKWFKETSDNKHKNFKEANHGKISRQYFLLSKQKIHAIFYKQHFYKQHQAKNGKLQNPKAELLVFEKHSLSSSSLSSKTNRTYSKIYAKNNYLCFNEVIRLIIMNVKTKKKIRLHR